MNHKFKISASLAMLLTGAGLLLQSCEMDKPANIPLVELGAPQKSFIVEAESGQVKIPIFSNGDYHIEDAFEGQDWATLNKRSGNGDDTLVVDCGFNEEFKRMASIIIISDVDSRRDTIQIKQKGLLEATLKMENTSVIAQGAGGETTVPILTNIPFEYMDVQKVYASEGDEWITDSQIIPSEDGGDNCDLMFITTANPNEKTPRTATVRFSFTDGWGDQVAVTVNLVQRNAQEGLGEIISFKDFKDAYSTGKAIEDYVIIEGVVVSNKESGNAGENEQSTTSAIDYEGTEKTVYLQDKNAAEGICIMTQTPQDNIFKQFDKVQILLHGATLTMKEFPERYVLGGVTKAMVVSQISGTKADIPVKEKYMNELTVSDIYTYTTLKDCEIPIRKGSICPVNEGYTTATGAHRLSKYPLLIRDINGDAMYMYTNTVCKYRNDGTRLPYGSGKLSGVIVHERFSRFSWRDGADPVDMDTDPDLGNIGTFQLRHQCKEDVWGHMEDNFENGFSALLTEYRFWNPDKENEVCRPTYGENGWFTHTYQTKYTNDENLDYTQKTYMQHFWGGGTYDYLGPIGNNTKYMFGDNWGNFNGVGIVLDPAKEHYNSEMSAFVSNNPDGTIEWCGPHATSKDAANNSGKGKGGINNQSNTMYGKGNVSGGCYNAFSSHFWWNDETNRPYGWLINVSTEGISTSKLSLQINVMNSQQTWYTPRFWVAEWSETDSQTPADDKEWKIIGKYTVPDVSVWSNTLYSSIVAFKSINMDLPLEMLGKENVYIRLRPENDLCSDGADYANARLRDCTAGTSLHASHASTISYIGIRYNK